MKSTLFSKNDYMEIDSFMKDMKKALALEPEILAKLPGLASRVLAASGGTAVAEIADEASGLLGVPRSNLDDCISITVFFLRKFAEADDAESDKPEDIASDVQELFKLSEEKRITLIDYFNNIRELADKDVKLIILRKAHARSSLPNLVSITTTVNFRVVFDKYFKQGIDLNSFSPKCLGTIPIGIINLNLEDSPYKEISFQTDKKSLRWLIESLVALEKQIDLAQSQLGLTEVSSDG